MYDASTTRWSEQMVLGSDSGANTDGPVPIEIDRVHQKGKGKSGKGKSNLELSGSYTIVVRRTLLITVCHWKVS